MPPFLPPELHDRIIDNFWDDLPALGTLALVHSSFRPAAQAHIFGETVLSKMLDPEATPDKLDRMLDGSPHIASLIQNIEITHDCLDDPALPRVLNRLTELKALEFVYDATDTRSWHNLSEELRDSILAHLPKVETFRVDFFHEFPLNILRTCGSLKDLMLRYVGFMPTDPYHVIIPQPVNALTTLEYQNDHTDDLVPLTQLVDPTANPAFSLSCLTTLILRLRETSTNHEESQIVQGILWLCHETLEYFEYKPDKRTYGLTTSYPHSSSTSLISAVEYGKFEDKGIKLDLRHMQKLETLTLQLYFGERSWFGDITFHEPMPFLQCALDSIPLDTPFQELHIKMHIKRMGVHGADYDTWNDLLELLERKYFDGELPVLGSIKISIFVEHPDGGQAQNFEDVRDGIEETYQAVAWQVSNALTSFEEEEEEILTVEQRQDQEYAFDEIF